MRIIVREVYVHKIIWFFFSYVLLDTHMSEGTYIISCVYENIEGKQNFCLKKKETEKSVEHMCVNVPIFIRKFSAFKICRKG